MRNKICPRCKSKNISSDLSLKTFGKGSTFNAWKCNECGYEGELFPEIDN